eukprot:scaffold1283_cov27-Phaeocystis_antarctica.AAC.1
MCGRNGCKHSPRSARPPPVHRVYRGGRGAGVTPGVPRASPPHVPSGATRALGAATLRDLQ